MFASPLHGAVLYLDEGAVNMLKIKITGTSSTERQMMQRCISKFLRHNNQHVVETEKGSSGVRQVITAAGPEVAMTECTILVESDGITSIGQLDQKIIARATGEAEATVCEERQWFVTVKKRAQAPQNRVVTAANPDKAIRILGDPGSFESITVRPA